jgi:hypothetical protein
MQNFQNLSLENSTFKRDHLAGGLPLYTSLVLMTSPMVLMLASCAHTTPAGQVTIPDPPPTLIENPPEFRFLKSRKPKLSTPPPVAHGVNKLLDGEVSTKV